MAQFVYLVHHAQALSGEIDHMRPLSSVGLAQAERVARTAVEFGAKPVVIWHSGKLRARQTADAWLRLVNPFATFAAMRGLQPDDDPDIVATALDGEDRDAVLTSHMPFLPALLHQLKTGRRDRLSAPFPLNGCVALERAGAVWQERWTIAP